MPIPKFRHVRYTDDGCCLFQCLTCYETWESRTCPSSWKFCPYCGISWQGEHVCRSHDEYKWEYGKPYRPLDIREDNRKRRWIIEERDVVLKNGETTTEPWECKYVQPDRTGHDLLALRHVIGHLKSLRRNEDNKEVEPEFEAIFGKRRTEYRARIAEIQPYCSTIWWWGKPLTLLDAWMIHD